jgi:hypothetical protein
MPERFGKLVGLKVAKIDDFEFREFVWPLKFENDRYCRRIAGADYAIHAGIRAGDVNGLCLEPVGETKNVNTGEREREGNEYPISFSHNIFECGGRMNC